MIDLVGVIIVLQQEVVSGMTEPPDLKVAVVGLGVMLGDTRARSSVLEGI